MTCGFHSYQSLKKWKEEQILNYRSDVYSLNKFHDRVMQNAFQIALERINRGKPPSWKFAWFVTGSGGRMEQGFLSDQDHGLVYEAEDPLAREYFLRLGEELADGLQAAGYSYCEGKVMSSNPVWCQPLQGWKEQISKWIEEQSWQSMRNLHIFYDARVLAGEKDFADVLKAFIHDRIQNKPNLLNRLIETSIHVKNAIGPLGQLLPEEKGIHQGQLDLKYAAFIPYVNAVRLLSMKEGIYETPTIARLKKLENLQGYEEMVRYRSNFDILLKWRLSFYKESDTYDDTHFLQLKSLTKTERNELKRILKDGKKLNQYVRRTIEKGVI